MFSFFFAKAERVRSRISTSQFPGKGGESLSHLRIQEASLKSAFVHTASPNSARNPELRNKRGAGLQGLPGASRARRRPSRGPGSAAGPSPGWGRRAAGPSRPRPDTAGLVRPRGAAGPGRPHLWPPARCRLLPKLRPEPAPAFPPRPASLGAHTHAPDQPTHPDPGKLIL